MNCKTTSSGCNKISSSNGGAVGNPNGVNAVDTGGSYGTDVEPPDQAICSGSGYVMQVENLGELRVFNSNLGGGSAVITLDSLMGLPSIPASIGGPWSSGGDISCLYDYGNGGHWFITEIVSNSSEASGGAFNGCFAGAYDGCLEGIAVSVSSNPLGAYNVYFLSPDIGINNDPGQHYLLNDFGKIGNTRDAFLFFYDEFNFNPSTFPTCPAFGCQGFNGAQEFAFNKNALELGFPVVEPFGPPDAYFNVAYVNMGTDPNLYPVPANPPFQPAGASCISGTYAGAVCWYAVIPATSPDPTQFDNNNGGTGFMFARLDFFSVGDNRIAAFDWMGLSALNSYGCSSCGSITFGGQILNGVSPYIDEGAPCPVSDGGTCGIAAQKAGSTPLGDNCIAFGLSGSPCTEGGIETNGDFATQVSYADGQVWAGLPTLVTQKFGASSEIHAGVAYYALGTFTLDHFGVFSLANEGYVTAMHEDLEFPAIAATDSGTALITFTLSGNGGPTGADNGGFYPSTAYGMLSHGSVGLIGHTIRVADNGKSPQDGFTEYLAGGTSPRWGDYNAAIYVPSTPGSSTGRIYFATEMINAPPCSSSHFLQDPSCGMTRDPFANWGNSMNYVAT